MRILVVDDTPDNIFVLSCFIERFGHDYRAASDGYEALRIAEEFKPTAIFMDISMPGIDGYETARRLREEVGLSDVPIFGLSGFDPEPAKVKSSGMTKYFKKPINTEWLLEFLQSSTA